MFPQFVGFKPGSGKLDMMAEYPPSALIRIWQATLSGRIGKVVASHAEVARSISGRAEAAPISTMHQALRAFCP